MIKLYETDSYIAEWETRVTACVPEGEKFLIELESSAFFPEEGGQYADTGHIICDGKCINLLDGQIKNGIVIYTVDEYIAPASLVTCKLDFAKRFSRMQQHSGEHIVVGLIHNIYGYDNVGFHLSDDKPVTLDINGELSKDQIYEIEAKANEVVFANLPIVATLPSKSELAQISYRSKIEIDGQVRLVTIGEPDNIIDICACCAPHVSRTGEIGLIKVVDFEKYKGGMRISILCGDRALVDYKTRIERMSNLVKLLSVKEDKLQATVIELKNENSELKVKLNNLSEKLLLSKALELINGGKHCLFTDVEITPLVMKNIYNTLVEKSEGFVGIFVGNDAEGYRFNAGSSKLDSRKLADCFRQQLDSKCGGSSEMISGKVFRAQKDIEIIFDEMEEAHE